MAQQQDRHLTTEQLSALIDKQLSAEEQAACDVHLRSCQQCQGLLADLRQTVALLHALPQPALPRSFVLPAEVLHPAMPVLAAHASPQAPLHIDEGRRHVAQRTQAREQMRSHVLRRTLRMMSTIAAILGFIFLASALPIAHGGATTTSAGSASSGSANAPSVSSAANTPQLGQHAAATKAAASNLGKDGTPTPQPTATGTSTTFGKDGQQQPAASSTSPAFDILQSIGTALDPSTLGGRAIDGTLLIVLALLGFVIARRRPARPAPGRPQGSPLP